MSNASAEAYVLARHEPQGENPNRGGGHRGSTPAGRVVARWHDEEHQGAYSTCQEQPCLAVKAVDR